MGGGPALSALERLRRDRPISLHGVGLSLGGTDGIDAGHLARLAALVERLEPILVSEHLSWSIVEGIYLNDLLPLPYTEEALDVVGPAISTRSRTRLGRPILVENPSSYLRYRHSTIGEPEFLAELARRTGCGLLCDVNNIHVSARNFGFDPLAYLAGLPGGRHRRIPSGGPQRRTRSTAGDPDRRSRLRGGRAGLGALSRGAARFGPRPTLVEWDSRLPALSVLLGEAAKADAAGVKISREAADARAA